MCSKKLNLFSGVSLLSFFLSQAVYGMDPQILKEDQKQEISSPSLIKKENKNLQEILSNDQNKGEVDHALKIIKNYGNRYTSNRRPIVLAINNLKEEFQNKIFQKLSLMRLEDLYELVNRGIDWSSEDSEEERLLNEKNKGNTLNSIKNWLKTKEESEDKNLQEILKKDQLEGNVHHAVKKIKRYFYLKPEQIVWAISNLEEEFQNNIFQKLSPPQLGDLFKRVRDKTRCSFSLFQSKEEKRLYEENKQGLPLTLNNLKKYIFHSGKACSIDIVKKGETLFSEYVPGGSGIIRSINLNEIEDGKLGYVTLKITKDWGRKDLVKMTLLPISHLAFDDSNFPDVEQLALLFPKPFEESEFLWKNLTGISLVDLRPEIFESLFNSKFMKKITSLRLSRYKSESPINPHLLNSPNFSSLTSLDIGMRGIPKPGQVLGESKSLTNLKKASIGGLSDDDIRCWANSENMKNVTSLSLWNERIPEEWKVWGGGEASVRITPKGIEYLAEGKSTNNLVELFLNHLDVQDEGIKAISESLYITKLERIELWDCRITEKGISWLTESKNMSNLKRLGLRWTSVKDEGALKLSSLKQLTDLDVCSTGITERGTQALADMGLERLELAANFISNKGFEILLKGKIRTTVRFLGVSNCGINDTKCEFIPLIQKLPYLERLELGNIQEREHEELGPISPKTIQKYKKKLAIHVSFSAHR